MSGKMPAHMTAKIVMASAARLMEVRQRWRKRKRIAEISVPACPMPIHQTKLTMAQPHMTGWPGPHTPTPTETRYRIMEKHAVIMITLGMNAHHHQRGVLPSATPAIASEIQPIER